MKKILSAVLNIRVTAFFFLIVFGMSACAPMADQSAMDGKKKAKKKVVQMGLLSCSTPGMQKSCVAVSPNPVPYKRRVKVLIASGMDMTDRSKQAGADGFILKPFIPDELIGKIQQTLG